VNSLVISFLEVIKAFLCANCILEQILLVHPLVLARFDLNLLAVRGFEFAK